MKRILFVVALVLLASLTVYAADVREGGVPTRISLKKIYSNLGPSTDLFDCEEGWLILGPDSYDGEQQWIGFPVTLSKPATVTQLRAAMFYYGGFGSEGNDFNLGIWSDSSGVPGKEIHGANKRGMLPYGECSIGIRRKGGDILHVNIQPTKLKAKTQYWMVITNAKNSPDASGAWDFTYNLSEGTQAYDLGSGWNTQHTYIAAFAWYGR